VIRFCEHFGRIEDNKRTLLFERRRGASMMDRQGVSSLMRRRYMVLATVLPSMGHQRQRAAALIGDFDGSKSHQNEGDHPASGNFRRGQNIFLRFLRRKMRKWSPIVILRCEIRESQSK